MEKVNKKVTEKKIVLAKDTRLIVVILVGILVVVGLWQAICPWMAEFYYRKGFVENTYKRYPESMQSLETAMKYAPWETYYMITQVRNYEEMSRAAQTPDEQKHWLLMARKAYDYMLKINPTNPWFWSGVASIDLGLMNLQTNIPTRQKYFNAADVDYSTAASIDMKNPLFVMSKAFFLHRSGRVDEAYRLYERCLVLDNVFVEALYNMAEIDIARGQYDVALNHFEMMASADRKEYDPSSKAYSIWVKGGDFNGYRSRMAELYMFKREFKKAIDMFKWALEMHPDDAKIWRGLGVAYQQDGQSDLAVYAYRQAAMIDPEMGDVNKYMAYINYSQGLYNSSIDNLKRYVEAHPEDQKARSDLEKIQMIQQYRKR